MSENICGDDQKFQPMGWEIVDQNADRLEEQGVIHRLTDEEVAALRRGEPVPGMIPQRVFADFEAFMTGRNNLHLYFGPVAAGAVRQRLPERQRLEVIDPNLVWRLVEAIEPTDYGEHYDLGEKITLASQDLFLAYQKMSVLVSAHDWRTACLTPEEAVEALII